MKKSIILIATAFILVLVSCSNTTVGSEFPDTSTPLVEIAKPNEGALTKAEFTKIINENKLTMVDFYTVWCGPCKRMAPSVEKAKNTFKDVANVLSVEAEQNMEISSDYPIEGYPTLYFFKAGQVVYTSIGEISYDKIAELINKYK